MKGTDDFEKFRLPRTCVSTRSEAKPQAPMSKKGGMFIRGPIYLDWLEGVLKLPGRAPLVLALALVFQAGLEKSQTVRLTRKLMNRFRLCPRTCYDALAKMEGAKLVVVTRRSGCCREVMIMPAEPACSEKTCED